MILWNLSLHCQQTHLPLRALFNLTPSILSSKCLLILFILLNDSHILCMTNLAQENLFYIAPSFWNNLPDPIKKTNTFNTFKDNVKTLELNQ